MAICSSLNSILKTNSCEGNNVGGIYTVYIADQLDVSGYTTDINSSASGYTITGMTMIGSVKHNTFQFNRNLGNFKVETTVDLLAGSTYHKATLTLKFLRREASKSRAIQILGEGQRYLSVIIKDAVGTYTYMDFAQVSGGGEDTGTKKEDGNSYDVVITSDMISKPLFINEATVTSVVTVL